MTAANRSLTSLRLGSEPFARRAGFKVIDGVTGLVSQPVRYSGLKSLELEARVVLLASRMIAAGTPLTEEDRTRLKVAQIRIKDACEVLHVR